MISTNIALGGLLPLWTQTVRAAGPCAGQELDGVQSDMSRLVFGELESTFNKPYASKSKWVGKPDQARAGR